MSEISVLISEEDIQKAVDKMGKELTEVYKGKKLLIVSVLKGGFVFTSDIVRRIENEEMKISFIKAKSYIGTQSSGNVVVTGDDDIKRMNLKHWDVLITEDVIDTGRTLYELKKHFLSCGASSVKIAACLDKPSKRVVDIKPDYHCFEIDDVFAVGYGLDYIEKYRQLPYVGVLNGSK